MSQVLLLLLSAQCCKCLVCHCRWYEYFLSKVQAAVVVAINTVFKMLCVVVFNTIFQMLQLLFSFPSSQSCICPRCCCNNTVLKMLQELQYSRSYVLGAVVVVILIILLWLYSVYRMWIVWAYTLNFAQVSAVWSLLYLSWVVSVF